MTVQKFKFFPNSDQSETDFRGMVHNMLKTINDQLVTKRIEKAGSASV